jgi:hypothetical protein
MSLRTAIYALLSGNRPSKLHGDSSLLSFYPDDEPSDFIAWNTTAWCWDNYPLPDGRMNPTGRLRRQNGQKGHLTITPPVESIDAAFTELLRPVLKGPDEWVLEIPRSFGATATLDARVLISSSGGAALVMPKAILGMVYVMNEIVSELKANTRSHLSQAQLRFVRAHYAEILAYLLLQKKSDSREVALFIMELDRLRYERTADERSSIWSFGVAQQLFVLLPEFGHLVHSVPASLEPSATKVVIHRFSGLKQELEADRWAGSHLRQAHKHSHKWPYWETSGIALLILFGAMDLLRKNGFLPDLNRTALSERLATTLHCPPGTGEELLGMAEEVLWGGGSDEPIQRRQESSPTSRRPSTTSQRPSLNSADKRIIRQTDVLRTMLTRSMAGQSVEWLDTLPKANEGQRQIWIGSTESGPAIVASRDFGHEISPFVELVQQDQIFRRALIALPEALFALRERLSLSERHLWHTCMWAFMSERSKQLDNGVASVCLWGSDVFRSHLTIDTKVGIVNSLKAWGEEFFRDFPVKK